MQVDEIINDETSEMTSMKCELNTLSRADGSCILSHENNVMAVAVYGPVEVKLHKLLIDRAHVEIIYKPKIGSSQITDRLQESIIGKICETAILTTFYPRSAIHIIVQELQSGGATLACCINAACLALIHAGISMNYLFAAVTSSVPAYEITPSTTKDFDESTITFVFESTSEKILAVDSYGIISKDEYIQCLKKCRASSRQIFKFYRDMISKYALKM